MTIKQTRYYGLSWTDFHDLSSMKKNLIPSNICDVFLFFKTYAYIRLCTDTCRCMEHPIAPSFRNLLGWVLIMLLTGLDFRGWRAGWHFYMEFFLAPKRLVFRVILLSSWCFPPRYKERGRPGGRKTPPQWWRRGVAWGRTGVCRGRWAWVPAPRF